MRSTALSLTARTIPIARTSPLQARYAVNMLATVCGCGDTCYYPVDPRCADMVQTIDEIVVGRQAVPVELEGHTWHRVGPLTAEDMETLGSAALGFFMDF